MTFRTASLLLVLAFATNCQNQSHSSPIVEKTPATILPSPAGPEARSGLTEERPLSPQRSSLTVAGITFELEQWADGGNKVSNPRWIALDGEALPVDGQPNSICALLGAEDFVALSFVDVALPQQKLGYELSGKINFSKKYLSKSKASVLCVNRQVITKAPVLISKTQKNNTAFSYHEDVSIQVAGQVYPLVITGVERIAIGVWNGPGSWLAFQGLSTFFARVCQIFPDSLATTADITQASIQNETTVTVDYHNDANLAGGFQLPDEQMIPDYTKYRRFIKSVECVSRSRFLEGSVRPRSEIGENRLLVPSTQHWSKLLGMNDVHGNFVKLGVASPTVASNATALCDKFFPQSINQWAEFESTTWDGGGIFEMDRAYQQKIEPRVSYQVRCGG